VVAVRGYLRYGFSYRDVEELLAERGIEVDHVTVYRWVQRFTPCWLTPPGSPATHRRPLVCRREAYVKVNGVWRYVYRVIDQHGQVSGEPEPGKCRARRRPRTRPSSMLHRSSLSPRLLGP